jgi:hypothetical protein
MPQQVCQHYGTQIYHAGKDDRKSQGTAGMKTKNFAFPMFLDQNRLASI